MMQCPPPPPPPPSALRYIHGPSPYTLHCKLRLLAIWYVLLTGCSGHEIEFASVASPTPVAPLSVNGKCHLSERNKCQVGIFKNAPNTDTHYRWVCNGLRGGIREFCQKNMPVSGTCNEALPFHCSTGAFQQQKNTNTDYKWQCRDLHRGDTAYCSAPLPSQKKSGGTSSPTPIPTPVVNGACNNIAPNTCLAGTFTDVTNSNTHYRWTCTGLNGGTNANCQAAKPVNGTCGATKNTCTKGTLEDTIDSNRYYFWLCHGENGGRTHSCHQNIPLNGACGTLKDTCHAGIWKDGTSSNNLTDTTTHFKWKVQRPIWWHKHQLSNQ